MPSPNYTSRASTVPPSHVNSAEAAFRPDDLRISRPIEILRESNGGLNQQLSTRLMSVDGTWPRKGANATSRASAGPSMLNDSLSSGPSRGSLSKKNGGFRATIRRMFGSKRHRDTMESVGDGYHYYVSQTNITRLAYLFLRICFPTRCRADRLPELPSPLSVGCMTTTASPSCHTPASHQFRYWLN